MYPVLFDSSFIIIYSLWFFLTLGFVLGGILFYRLVQNSRLDISFITHNFFKLAFASIISSRLFAIIANPRYFFRADPEEGVSIFGSLWNVLTVWDKELSLWGAILGFLIIFIREAHQEKVNLAKWADILAVSTIIGISIGNIGAFLDGINYGKPTIFPWGVTFQSAFIKYAVPIHPTQIYAAIYTALIALFLYYLYLRYRSQYDGIVAYSGIFLFSSMRFLEGFLRGDDVLMLGPIRFPQLSFFLIAVISGYLLRKYQKRYNVPIFSLIPKLLHLDKINWDKLGQRGKKTK